jgi:hypothetical protein
MECPNCKQVIPSGETLTHLASHGTCPDERNENTDYPALAGELNPVNTAASIGQSEEPQQLLSTENTENAQVEAADTASSSTPLPLSTDSFSTASLTASITSSTEPATENEHDNTDSDESAVDSRDSSPAIVAPALTSQLPASETPTTSSSAVTTSATASSTPSLTPSTDPLPETQDEHDNGENENESTVDSDDSSSTIVPQAPTPRPSSPRRPIITRPRRPTESYHSFDFHPFQTEPFPDFVDTPPPNAPLVNGVNGIHNTGGVTHEAPLPSAEYLSRRPRREEIHYSDQVRANILANIFGLTTNRQVLANGQINTSYGQASAYGQASPRVQFPTSGRVFTSYPQAHTNGQASISGQAPRGQTPQASSDNNSSSTNTGTSNNNRRNPRNNRSSGPEDCLPYINGITRFRRDEDEGDDGPSSTPNGGFSALNA